MGRYLFGKKEGIETAGRRAFCPFFIRITKSDTKSVIINWNVVPLLISLFKRIYETLNEKAQIYDKLHGVCLCINNDYEYVFLKNHEEAEITVYKLKFSL